MNTNIKCTPAMADAVTKIFLAEHIPYSFGYGPACIVIIIERSDLKRAREVLRQWKDAVDSLCKEVEHGR